MSDPEAERKAKAARAKALVSEAKRLRTRHLTFRLETLHPALSMNKLNNADLLASEETQRERQEESSYPSSISRALITCLDCQ
jgi:hypothetical protein